MAAGPRGRSGEVKGFVPNRNITRPLIIFLPSNEKPLRRSDASGRADRVCAKFPAPVKKAGSNSLRARNNSLRRRVGNSSRKPLHLQLLWRLVSQKRGRFLEIPCFFPCRRGILAVRRP